MKKNLIVFVFGILGLASSAQAAGGNWVFEPYLGYGTGSISSTTKGGSAGSVSLTGIPLGFRFNRIFGHFFMGLEAQYTLNASGTQTTPACSGASCTATGSETLLAVNIGGIFNMFSFWAGYIPYDNMVLTSGAVGAVPFTYSTGGSYQVGLGYWFMPKFGMSLNYTSHNTKTYEASGITVNIIDVYSKYDTTTYGVQLTFPMAF